MKYLWRIVADWRDVDLLGRFGRKSARRVDRVLSLKDDTLDILRNAKA